MNVSIDTLEIQHVKLPSMDYSRIDTMTTLLFIACVLYAAGLLMHLFEKCKPRRQYDRVDENHFSDCAL